MPRRKKGKGIGDFFRKIKNVGDVMKKAGIEPSKLVGLIPHPLAQSASQGLKTVGYGMQGSGVQQRAIRTHGLHRAMGVNGGAVQHSINHHHTY
jgi:hypothetical protein